MTGQTPRKTAQAHRARTAQSSHYRTALALQSWDNDVRQAERHAAALAPDVSTDLRQ
ncbi:MAG TPA: hypothetical protein VFQ25_08640 [Ktedonobacterales bacterium]|nr:hypothetical protein [Ktedonobacterales bacterium]